jgi:hypothetical protein
MAHLVKISLYRKHEGVEKCLAFVEATPIMAMTELVAGKKWSYTPARLYKV